MRYVLALSAGIIIGIVSTIAIYYYLNKDYHYIELVRDFQLEDGGLLKAGSLLRYDAAYPEGFSRYMLYVNIMSYHDDHTKLYQPKEGERSFVVMPCWAEPIE